VAAQDFSYSGATFTRDSSPPALPAASSSWREIKVLDLAHGNSLLRAFPANLTPVQTGHGVYAQYALGDVVLFRDSTGNVQVVPFEKKPADVTVDRRYNRQELASAIAGFLEKELRAMYPNETAFVLLWPHGERVRTTFLDLEERETVSLFPAADDTQRGQPKLGGGLKTLISFALVDNAWAFLKNPVSSTTRAIHQGVQWGATVFEPRLRDKTAPVPPLTNAPGMDLIAWENWLDRHTGAQELGSIRLLINGEAFYPEFERRVAEARSNINIHVCIFDRDDVGVRMADLLKARSTNITRQGYVRPAQHPRRRRRSARHTNGGGVPAAPLDCSVPPGWRGSAGAPVVESRIYLRSHETVHH
jgi:hypothetical protein